MAGDPQIDTRRQYCRKSHSPCDTSAGRLRQMLLMPQFAFMVDHGVAITAGSPSVGVIGITSIPAKILWGTLSDRIGRELTYSFGLACILLSVLAGSDSAGAFRSCLTVTAGQTYFAFARQAAE